MKVQSSPSNSGLKVYVRQCFNEHSLNTVQYSVEKQHVSILCLLHSRGQSSCRLPRLRAVSKGLNAPDLTFDPIVCEKSKSKVRPKKKFARLVTVPRLPGDEARRANFYSEK